VDCASGALAARLASASAAELGTGGESARRTLTTAFGKVQAKLAAVKVALGGAPAKAKRKIGAAARTVTAFAKKARKLGRRKISAGLAADLVSLADTLGDRLAGLRLSL
jgi:hypothetical protein